MCIFEDWWLFELLLEVIGWKFTSTMGGNHYPITWKTELKLINKECGEMAQWSIFKSKVKQELDDVRIWN